MDFHLVVEDSEAVFENYWGPVSHSSVGSACRLVSPQVFLHRGIPAHSLLLSSTVEEELKTFACSLKCNKLAYFFKAAALPMPWTREVVSHPKMA